MDEARELNLGLGGAWGYGRGDLTSPVQAASAGALDHAAGEGPPADVTELRIHGVGGSSPERMLEHPHSLQVGGDTTTMFFRRWNPTGPGRPSVPWRLEAYSWGGLTEAAWASSVWLLFFPFLLYNLAHFALPQYRSGGRDQWLRRRVVHALLRLSALAATAQFTLAPLVALLNGLAYQAGLARLPSWASGWAAWPIAVRAGAAEAATGMVIAVVWVASVVTAHRYERRVHGAQPADAGDPRPLDDPLFWCGYETVRRQRSLHTAVALATVALVVARPGPATWADRPRLVVAVAAGVVLATAAILSLSALADRARVIERCDPAGDTTLVGTWICRGVLFAAVGTAAAGAFCGWSEPSSSLARADATVPGLGAVAWGVLAVQGGLVVLVALLVLSSGAPARVRGADVTGPERRQCRGPFALGQLATVFVVLAWGLGATLTLVVSVLVIRPVAAPVPAGTSLPVPSVQIPVAVYGMALVPVGVAAGGVLIGLVVFAGWCHNTVFFARRIAHEPSPVAVLYSGQPVDEDGFSRHRRQVARAWATGLLVDRAGAVAAAAAVAAVLAGASGEIVTARHTAFATSLTVPVGAESVIAAAVAAGLVALLRADLRGSARRSVGVVWDVATFWPRACHPLAPPCYAERAVPELVDRVRLLADADIGASDHDPAYAQVRNHTVPGYTSPPGLRTRRGRVLLTGYSQGAVIAPAVVAQLPRSTTDKVSLLTLASPLRRLYGRAFPAYMGTGQIAGITRTLTSPGTEEIVRWKNLVRRSDYIGSWVIAPPEPPEDIDRSAVSSAIDQVCWDPVVVAPDTDQAPPLIHRHSSLWADERAAQLAASLIYTHAP